jgi:hypothetical protein
MNNLGKTTAGLIVALALASTFVLSGVTLSSADEGKCVQTSDGSGTPVPPICQPDLVQQVRRKNTELARSVG